MTHSTGLLLFSSSDLINSSLSGQNNRHFADDIFGLIFMNENFCILIKISLKFVPKVPIDKKKLALV